MPGWRPRQQGNLGRGQAKHGSVGVGGVGVGVGVGVGGDNDGDTAAHK